MAIRVAINGFGRIGRLVLRVLMQRKDFEVVAINDLDDAKSLAHLLKYDTVHGRYEGSVVVEGQDLIVDGKRVKTTKEKDPAKLPWAAMKIDFCVESTGIFTTKADCEKHVTAGAKKVILTVPPKDEVDAMIVMGVNEAALKKEHKIISNASCTTNCLAPMAKVLNDTVGIVNGLMTTVHAYTNDQVLTDVFHKDLRRARAAAQNMIPTKTGAAAAVGLVLPELNGKLDGYAIRVPTINVSVVDLSFIAGRDTTVAEINAALKAASEAGPLKGILGYNTAPLVSSDFNHDPRSSIFDSTLTKVSGRLCKASSWYDNEWGFSNRMLDATVALMAAK